MVPKEIGCSDVDWIQDRGQRSLLRNVTITNLPGSTQGVNLSQYVLCNKSLIFPSNSKATLLQPLLLLPISEVSQLPHSLSSFPLSRRPELHRPTALKHQNPRVPS